MLLTYLCFAGFLSMLGLAAFKDLRERRIPNRLTAGLALLYPIYVVTSPVPLAWPVALGIAAVVFLIGLGLFARELIGGGDVKLIAAVSLWAGPEHFVWFMLITTLTGGALSLIGLWCRRWSGVIGAHLAALGLATTASAGAILPEAPQSVVTASPATLPYGVAIAVGGIAVAIQLLKL
ncbi:MAG: A24 family peptidase [Geminicoccaceae bacterium]